jgi:hypothetical protein
MPTKRILEQVDGSHAFGVPPHDADVAGRGPGQYTAVALTQHGFVAHRTGVSHMAAAGRRLDGDDRPAKESRVDAW